MGDSILMRARLLAKAVTAVYDDKLRPFGISAAQFVLISAISQNPMTRAEIARLHHLNRSTLTRDLKEVLSAGWIEEVQENKDGRSRPISLTKAGKELMLNARPAWRVAQAEAQALLGQDGVNVITRIADRITACANVDYYLAQLNNASVAAEKRRAITKLLIDEEDRFSHDLEQLEFAEGRAAVCRARADQQRRALDSFALGSADWMQANTLLLNFESLAQFVEAFCTQMRNRMNAN